jgi:predicted nucleic acid-binding Zn ribbon protein
MPTARKIDSLLSQVLHQLREVVKERPDLVLSTWPEIVGNKIAPMTRALSFIEGVLFVQVKNSTLLSLLVNYEKKRLLLQLRKKCPHTEIRDIVFRIG